MATGVINFNDGYVDTPGYREFVEVPNYYSERTSAFTFRYFGPATAYYLGPITASATGSGLGSEAAVGDVIAIVEETATGSGTGTQSATGVITPVRTATGSGTGTSTSTFIRGYQRTATGSGAGTGVASANPVQARTATGTGTGTSAVTQIMTAFRTATGSGVGTSTASSIELLPRTATGSGSGATGSTATGVRVVQRTVSDSGTGTQSAIGKQLYLFRTPTDRFVRWASRGGSGPAHALFKFYRPGERGRNVYKMVDGTFSEVDQREPANYLKIYHGGHDHLVEYDERQELIAAGYGDYIS